MHSRSKNRTEKEENAEMLLCDTNGINAKSHIFLSPTIRGVGGRGRENPSKSKIKRVSVRRSSLVMELIPRVVVAVIEREEKKKENQR